jgi:threonine/homoserine/homoserine lactone efflux protein
VFHKTGIATVNVSGSVSLTHFWTRERVSWQASGGWALLLLILTVALAYSSSFNASGWLAFWLSLAGAVVLYLVGLSVLTQVREIRKGETKHEADD